MILLRRIDNNALDNNQVVTIELYDMTGSTSSTPENKSSLIASLAQTAF
jgi:hypothetical protein